MEKCVFCEIIKGALKTEFIYEDEFTAVFKDINPKAAVHLLVVPKVHIVSLNECADEKLLSRLMMTVRTVTNQLGIKSYRTVINTGKEAGQAVFHLHIHILSGDIKR